MNTIAVLQSVGGMMEGASDMGSGGSAIGGLLGLAVIVGIFLLILSDRDD